MPKFTISKKKAFYDIYFFLKGQFPSDSETQLQSLLWKKMYPPPKCNEIPTRFDPTINGHLNFFYKFETIYKDLFWYQTLECCIYGVFFLCPPFFEILVYCYSWPVCSDTLCINLWSLAFMLFSDWSSMLNKIGLLDSSWKFCSICLFFKYICLSCSNT